MLNLVLGVGVCLLVEERDENCVVRCRQMSQDVAISRDVLSAVPFPPSPFGFHRFQQHSINFQQSNDSALQAGAKLQRKPMVRKLY